ncbi:MAG: hypothetical protein AMJ53_07005 [Gammaproteobacteria bacterium SG8_11]|nr:MAG: hypothetical protein AMJ53_07005 [Gammaproteobacteria bacterium SG8_11]
MQCDNIQSCIDDYLDGQLPASQQHLMQAHLARCADCATALQQKTNLLRQLRNLPAPRPQPGLKQQITAMRTTRHASHWRWFAAGVATAMAAGLAVFVVTILLNPMADKRAFQSAVTAKLHQTNDVYILVHSEHTLEDVRFTLLMPESLQLDGYQGRQQLQWHGRLQQGENLLSLPLKAMTPTTGTLVVKIEHGNSSKEYYVTVSAESG